MTVSRAGFGRLVGCALGYLVLLFAAVVSAQEGETYAIDVDGRKTWSLQFGLGDSLGLAASGLVPGQLTLDQTLAVDITGQALSVLSIEAHFDDQQSEGLQSLAVLLDTDRLDGVLGDFVAEGIGSFAAYGRKMKGLRVEYTLGDALLTGIASKLEGVSETRTFVGQKAHDEVTFSAYTQAAPPEEMPYGRHIDGLFAYPLAVFYVEEFSAVSLTFDASGALRDVLTAYGLEYLVDPLAEDGSFPLEDWEYDVIGEEEQTLLLGEPPIDLVRDRLEEAIDLYNEENGLSGDDAKEYPLTVGTAYELAFLEEVAARVSVFVDAEGHAVLGAVRRRFYDLGKQGIVEGSSVVEVSADGGTFESIAGPAYADYAAEVFVEEGILEAEFPADFFTKASAIRVEFDYSVVGGAFMLGLSIIPGTDRVTVNGAPLERDTDYQIDYEIGMLVLLVEVGETDVIQIDYERFAGGILGVSAGYATYFYAVTLDWPISDALTIQASLLQSAEDPGSVTDPASVKTMPNRHTIAGVSGVISLDGFGADFLVAYSDDRFPFDDNARVNRANEVAAIVAAKDHVFLGHRAGLTVRRAGEWVTYGTGQGLAGRSVQAIAVGSETLFVGTNAGLTVVSLVGSSPLDRVANWTSYYADEDEGLPSGSVTALHFADGVLWVGTDAGLVAVRLEDIDLPEEWRRFDEQVDLGEVRALGGDGEKLYVGTDDGLYEHSPIAGTWDLLPGSEGLRVHDLALDGGTLYVASSRGLRTYRDGIGTGWLVLGEEVLAVEAFEGRIAFGTESGLFDAADGTAILADATVTALDAVGDALWVGTRADADYALAVWELGETETVHGSGETGIDGRDPFAFEDADASEHTWNGFVERASFRRSADGFALSGSVENVSPSYRSIGSLSRNDSTGWDIAGTWELGPDLQLRLSHEAGLTGRLSDAPESETASDLFLTWTLGPVLTMNAHLDTSNEEPEHEGLESTYASYRFSLRDELFAERLDIGISWSDGYTWGYEREGVQRDSRLTVSAEATILPSWSAKLDWARPIRAGAGDWAGSESLTLRTGWSGDGASVDVGVDYALQWQRSVPGGSGSRDHDLEVDVSVVPVETGGWKITPSAEFGASTDESTVDVDGRLTARARQGDLSIQGSLRGALTGLRGPVVRETEKLSLTASYSGVEALRPSLSYSLDRQVAVYEAKRQTTLSHSLSGRATWSPKGVHYDELALTLTSKGGQEEPQITATLENSYRFNLAQWAASWDRDAVEGTGYPALDLRLDTELAYRHSADETDVDATATGRLNAAFSQTWSGSFGVSYFSGTGSADAFYHSLLFDLTVAIDF